MCVCATVNKSNFHRSPSTTMSIGDDVVVVGSVKKSKKRKDKSAKVDAEQAQHASPLLKAMKKRKREENGEGEGEQRKKKKKRKDTADVPSVEEPTPTAVEEKVAEEQSAPGIDKRAKKKKELRKELKKQQKALAKARDVSSSTDPAAASKPAPPIKNNTINAEKYLSENAITIHGDVVPVLDFDQLDIQPPLREVLNKFSAPTPIQACAWPALLEGKDVIGIAETGRFVPNA